MYLVRIHVHGPNIYYNTEHIQLSINCIMRHSFYKQVSIDANQHLQVNKVVVCFEGNEQDNMKHQPRM